MKRPHITVIAFLFAAACGSPTEPSSGPLALGWWTASQSGAALHVEEPETTLFLGCYYGVLPRPTLDKNGRFEVNGSIRGGPGPSNGSGAPATFTGQSRGSLLTITVSTDFNLFGGNTHTYELRFDGDTPKNPVPVPCA
ncbi:MAG TPA: hypothetical protein VIO12_10450 [Thermoanaerobaculia bacterium]